MMLGTTEEVCISGRSDESLTFELIDSGSIEIAQLPPERCAPHCFSVETFAPGPARVRVIGGDGETVGIVELNTEEPADVQIEVCNRLVEHDALVQLSEQCRYLATPFSASGDPLRATVGISSRIRDTNILSFISLWGVFKFDTATGTAENWLFPTMLSPSGSGWTAIDVEAAGVERSFALEVVR